MLKNLLVSLIGFALLFLGWEIAAHYFQHLLFILPAPSEIFADLLKNFDRFRLHSLVTLKEMLGGFCLALCAAFPLAWSMLLYKTARALLQPFFIIIQCLPMFTLAPIMVIWFGWSYTAIVIPTALMIFFPLTMNIYQGLRSTPHELLDFFKANQATSWQLFFKLQLPWSASHIFGGLRIASGIAGIGAVAGEWAGAQEGLGILMLESRRNTDLETTFGALFCLTILSAFLYATIVYAEKFFAFSQKKYRLKNRSILISLLLFMVSLTFFSYQEVQPKAHPKKTLQTTRLLLDWLPNPNHIPLYAGLEKGFFEEEGIDLYIQKMHENDHGISYLTAEKADLLINHMPGTLREKSKGARIKIVGTLIKQPLNGIIYRENIGIKKLKDLNGKRLGFCVGGSDAQFLDRILEENAIVFSEAYNVGVDLISSLGTHNVDAIFGAYWNIEPAQFDALGVAVSYFPLIDFNVPNYYELIILAREHSKETQSGFTQRFHRALQKSIDFCKAFPEQAFCNYLKSHPDKREKTIEWEKKAWCATWPLLCNNQTIEWDMVSQFFSWMYERHFLHCSFDVKDLSP